MHLQRNKSSLSRGATPRPFGQHDSCGRASKGHGAPAAVERLDRDRLLLLRDPAAVECVGHDPVPTGAAGHDTRGFAPRVGRFRTGCGRHLGSVVWLHVGGN